MRLRAVVNQTRAQGGFIAAVFDVHLGQGEGLLRLSSPVGQVANLALAPGLHQPVTPQDAADGVFGKRASFSRCHNRRLSRAQP